MGGGPPGGAVGDMRKGVAVDVVVAVQDAEESAALDVLVAVRDAEESAAQDVAGGDAVESGAQDAGELVVRGADELLARDATSVQDAGNGAVRGDGDNGS